jgi:NitT/TauT family transport system permease protein
MKAYTLKNKKYITIAIAFLIMLWFLLAYKVNSEVIIPTPESTMKSLFEIVTTAEFVKIVSATLMRIVVSFIISLSCALVLGLAASLNKIMYNFMIPILTLLKSVPTMGIIILALIWLSNDNAPIFIGIIMVFPILYESVLAGVINVDKKLLEMAKLFGVRRQTIIKDIYAPSILMNVNGVINSALGLGFKVVIASEVLGQPKYSIGTSLQLEKMYLNTSAVFAWIIIIVVLTVIFEQAIKYMYRKIYYWK